MPRPLLARRFAARLLGLLLTVGSPALADDSDAPAPDLSFRQFTLPEAWERRFWSDPSVQALARLEPRALADLVPVQAGLRYCRCPACDANEADDPLAWSPAKPEILTCRRCGVTLPNREYPAKTDKDGKEDKDGKVPADSVEVLPGVTHHYPYHAVAPEKQRYPEERLYLQAKRDYLAREFLAKTALYAAMRYARGEQSRKDPRLARMACVLILRFAQVYPAYATHYDQPGQPKYFQQADLPPPYRRLYRSAKWDWSGSLNVPVGLVIAYALLRDDPALAEAGQALGDPRPARTIEQHFFRASAEFVRRQPEEYAEMSLQAYRGILAVGRLLNDPELMNDASTRLRAFAERGFYHDGYWRQGDAAAHRRVLGLIDGWIDRLLVGGGPAPDGSLVRVSTNSGTPTPTALSMLELARQAGAVPLADPLPPEVVRTAWPAPTGLAPARHPALLGGTGLARLAVGQGADALDVEIRGLGNFGTSHAPRQALRVAVGGRTILGDLDDAPPTSTGWDRASASHNTVVVDGLNQRESLRKAQEPAPGANFLFFAADPDFQVAVLDDPQAYPQSTTRYRQTVVAASGRQVRYALSVFEVHGGLQHDQFFHAAAGSKARWRLEAALEPGPSSLLPPSLTFLPQASAEDGRWFVQAYGEFQPLGHTRIGRPTSAVLETRGGPALRLHLLNDLPTTLVPAFGPDPALSPGGRSREEEDGRSVLMVRRQAEQGATLSSTFVSLVEPLGTPSGIRRVGRVASPPGTVVVSVETDEGNEHVVVNLAAGTRQRVVLADGRTLRTDGVAVRVAAEGLRLAGGTFAEASPLRVVQPALSGTLRGAVREARGEARGFFVAENDLSASALAGRVLLVTHADGLTRGWTLDGVEPSAEGARLYVREEPGFTIEKTSGEAHYYQFPRTFSPGPHRFRISTIAR